jgi:hypothetical protein
MDQQVIGKNIRESASCKRPLQRPSWLSDEMEFAEIPCEPKWWLELAQGRFLWRVPLFEVFSLDVVGRCPMISRNSGGL